MIFKRSSIILAAITVILLFFVLFMNISANNSDENNPYKLGIPLHEMDFSFFDSFTPEVSYALATRVLMNKDYKYYSAPDKRSEISHHIYVNNVNRVVISEFGSSFETYPTYVRGWRYAVAPFLSEDEISALPKDSTGNHQYFTKDSILYIKTVDLIDIAFTNIDMRYQEQSFVTRLKLKWDLIFNGLFLKDRILFENGLFLSPDLPLYNILVFLSAIFAIITLISIFIHLIRKSN